MVDLNINNFFICKLVIDLPTLFFNPTIYLFILNNICLFLVSNQIMIIQLIKISEGNKNYNNNYSNILQLSKYILESKKHTDLLYACYLSTLKIPY